MRESAKDRSQKYIQKTSESLRRLKIRELPAAPSEQQMNYVLDSVRSYLKDAKHYSEKRKPVTSLACIAYAEGLLDAMKFLGTVDF